MTKAEDLEVAGEFASSMRGKYIVAQALHYAIMELEKIEGTRKEVSNIADMRYLRKHVYNFPVEGLDNRTLLGWSQVEVGEINRTFQKGMKQIQERATRERMDEE